MKKFGYFFIFLTASTLVPLQIFAEQTEKNYICDQKYALCTSASCIPAPVNPTEKAICQCTVQDGKSFGNQDCQTRAPRQNPDGSQMITSNYSFEEYSINKTMTCPAGNPWTFCLDRPCTVDPMDPKRAICNCLIKREEKFITLGGNCDTGSCKNGYWSGATLGDVGTAEKMLAPALGLKNPPQNLCPK